MPIREASEPLRAGSRTGCEPVNQTAVITKPCTLGVMDERTMTVREVLDRYLIGEPRLRAMIRTGELRAARGTSVGRREAPWQIATADVEALNLPPRPRPAGDEPTFLEEHLAALGFDIRTLTDAVIALDGRLEAALSRECACNAVVGPRRFLSNSVLSALARHASRLLAAIREWLR